MKIGTIVKLKPSAYKLFENLPEEDYNAICNETMEISDLLESRAELFFTDKDNNYHWICVDLGDIEISGYGGMADTLA